MPGKNRMQYQIDVDDNGSKVMDHFGDAVQDAARKVAAAGEEAGDGFTGGFGKIEGKGAAALSGFVGGLAALGATKLLEVGAALAGKLVDGFKGAVAARDLQAQLAVQLGLPPDVAAEAGEAAGRIYAENYGESLGEVQEAMRAVVQNVAGSFDEGVTPEIEKSTRAALTLSKAFGQDLAGTTAAVGQLMRTGLVADADEAFDVLTRGFQQGDDKAGDLLDTVTEYSTQFRDLGLSGTQAMGLLSQGLKAGARDADTVADALKEFAIRAQDGSTTTAAGFRALGLDGDRMTQVFARGGPEAAAGLDTVLDRLRRIEDPAKRQAAAVALFGTKAEDLQDSLFALDPSSAVQAMGDVEGAADKAGDTLGSTFGARWEATKRTAEMGFTSLGDKAVTALDRIGKSDAAQDLVDSVRQDVIPALREFTGWIGDRVEPKARELWDLFRTKGVPILKEEIPEALHAGRDALRDIQGAIEDNKPELLELWAAFKTGARVTMDGWKLIGPVVGGVFKAIAFSIAGGLTAISAFVRGWRAAQSATLTASRILVGGILNTFGVTVNAAARAFGWVPGIGPKLRSAAASFNRFRDEVNRSLGGIRDENVYVNIYTRGSGTNAVSRGSTRADREALLRGRAGGGPVQAGGTYLVGEDGPEVVTFGRTGRVIANPAAAARAAAAEVLAPIVLQLDSQTVWQGLLRIKNRGGRGFTLGLE